MKMITSQIKKFATQHMVGETAYIQELADGAVVNFDKKQDAVDYFLQEPAEFELVLYDGSGLSIAHKTPDSYYYN